MRPTMDSGERLATLEAHYGNLARSFENHVKTQGKLLVDMDKRVRALEMAGARRAGIAIGVSAATGTTAAFFFTLALRFLGV